MPGIIYRFGEYELDTALFRLFRAGEPVHVAPRALDLLSHLVAHRDRVVPKNELLDVVWGDRFVSEAALTTALRTVRLAVGDTGGEQRLIRTVHRRGYQFVGPLTVDPAGAPRRVGAGSVAAEGPSGADQIIRFCRADDGARIAYATLGSGPPLLKAANWMTHLDLERTSPVWSHWISGLARDRQLIRYDERGCGLSDWQVPGFGFDDWVDDLEAVVEAVGLDRFPLLGVSQGGAVAVAYAARHPERVSRLVLAGAYARGRHVRARDDAERDAAALDLDLAPRGVGPPGSQLPAGLRLAVPAGRHSAGMGGVRRVPAADDVAGQRGALSGGVRPDRRFRYRPPGGLPDADPALSRRRAGPGLAGRRTRRAHPRQPPRPAGQRQSPAHRLRTGLGRIPIPPRRVPDRVISSPRPGGSAWRLHMLVQLSGSVPGRTTRSSGSRRPHAWLKPEVSLRR
ncbi:alpha/beta fold hydrolase [Actinomadura madurae]